MRKTPEELSTTTYIDHRHVPSDCNSVPITPNITESPDSTSPYEPDDTFNTSESSLLITNATLSGIRVRILIDDGAELNHISQEFCIRHGISLKQEQYVASMANNTHQKLMSTVHPLTVTFGCYGEKMRFASKPLNFGLILTSKHNAIINCYRNEIKLEDKGKTHTAVAREQRNHSLVSVNAITKDHGQNYPLYAVVLRKIPETNQEISEKNRAQDVQRILQEYTDVFPKNLPKGLPRNVLRICHLPERRQHPTEKGTIPNALPHS